MAAQLWSHRPPGLKRSAIVHGDGEACDACRKGNVEDFIAYGFYAKRVEDLNEQVRLLMTSGRII